jgi:uncharacterized membrane-anchored protein
MAWLQGIPGKTITAIHLAMLNEGMDDPDAIHKSKLWLGEGTVIGAKMGRTSDNNSHSHLITNLRIGADGFERILVMAAPGTSENRAGRIAQRLLELETYRMIAQLACGQAAGKQVGDHRSTIGRNHGTPRNPYGQRRGVAQ